MKIHPRNQDIGLRISAYCKPIHSRSTKSEMCRPRRRRAQNSQQVPAHQLICSICLYFDIPDRSRHADARKGYTARCFERCASIVDEKAARTGSNCATVVQVAVRRHQFYLCNSAVQFLPKCSHGCSYPLSGIVSRKQKVQLIRPPTVMVSLGHDLSCRS